MQHWSIDRLNWARDLIGATRYLEIGVFKGETFVPFQCASKDAVDPEFRFDTDTAAADGTRFFQQTSDAFFRDPARDGEAKYDLVFIDGLHTYEQTLRDLMNVLLHTHDRSLILIDDTFPSDVFSAEPDQGRAYQHRKRTGSKDLRWHGDVYKLVYFIHDFLPTLSYATIRGAGNPQTLVWRQRRDPFKPVYNNTESISRLSYFDMFDRRRFLNLCDEETARARAASALATIAPGSG
ncbi:MAG: class I SAM-dependent methyltransferase [Marinibacterium sp.]